MNNVGKIPVVPVAMRETALGGLAATPTAKGIEHELFSNTELNKGR